MLSSVSVNEVNALCEQLFVSVSGVYMPLYGVALPIRLVLPHYYYTALAAPYSVG